MLFSSIPAELFLQTLSHLSIQDIHLFQLLNHRCNDLVEANESCIYHAAAVLHRFVPGAISLQEATCKEKWLNDVLTWKTFCERHFLLEAHWRGQRISPTSGLRICRYKAPGLKAFEFKIDEEEGTLVSSRIHGGIRVVSIATDELLWELPRSYGASYSHVEWSSGFLGFTVLGNRIEVWRRSIDAWDPQKYLPCDPRPYQLSATSLHAPIAPPEASNRGQRGVYVPHTAVEVPFEFTLLFRLEFPDLLMVSEESRKAHIWNLTTCRLTQIIDITPHDRVTHEILGFPIRSEEITSIDINKDYVFVCWSNAVNAYPRRQEENATSCCSFSFSNRGFIQPEGTIWALWRDLPFYGLSQRWNDPAHDLEIPLQTLVPSRQLVPTQIPSNFEYHESTELVAIQVSPDGKDLVAVTSHPCWLIYVKDFQKSAEMIHDSRYSFRTFLTKGRMVYLGFNGRRIVVGTYGTHVVEKIFSSIYVITLDDRRHLKDDSACLRPTIISLESLGTGVHRTSCIQMTDTHVWMTYPHGGSITSSDNEDQMDDPFEPCISYVDMTKAEKVSRWEMKRERGQY
ncbi:hypothetical protein FRC03_006821 [Tulasnella sp. 419]|nr:hypothetical protein FRC03_006821 [Tulasnella sp. 419]